MREPGEGFPSHAPKRCCDVAAIVPQSRPLIETFSEMPDFLHKRGNEARTRQSLNRIRGVIVQWTAQTDQGWMRHDAHTPARVCFISNQLIPLWNSSADRPISPALLLLASFQWAPSVAPGLHAQTRPGVFEEIISVCAPSAPAGGRPMDSAQAPHRSARPAAGGEPGWLTDLSGTLRASGTEPPQKEPCTGSRQV
jgi:hypothetical protein